MREAEWRLAQVCRRCCDPSSAAEPTKGACEPLRSAEDAGRTPVRSGSVLCKCITKVALVQRYSSCGHQVGNRYQSLISVYCRMVSFGLNILVCISKHRKYSLLGGTLCCFYFGVNCKWVVWYWAGLHLTSYFLNWDETAFFLSSHLRFEQIFHHSFCTCVPSLWFCYKKVYVCIVLCS